MEKRIAVVLGAYGGMGFNISLNFVKQGISLVMLGRDQNKLEQVETKLKCQLIKGQFIKTFVMDVGKTENVSSFIVFLNSSGICPDIIVNACGMVVLGKLHDITNNLWNNLINNNLIGVINFTTETSRLMKLKRQQGIIILINGVLSRQPDHNLLINSTITGAISNFAKAISKDLGNDGIRVNVINPGITNTNIYQQLKAEIASKNKISHGDVDQDVIKQSTNKRIAETYDIANAVTFLCSNKAQHINGIFLTIDGGTINSY